MHDCYGIELSELEQQRARGNVLGEGSLHPVALLPLCSAALRPAAACSPALVAAASSPLLVGHDGGLGEKRKHP
ncbi:hypothetical protein ACP4OV_004103 [Aristida adscensionis]